MGASKYGASISDTKVFIQGKIFGKNLIFPELKNFSMREELLWGAQEADLTV